MVFLAGDFLALAVAVGFVGRRGQGEVVLGGQGGVAAGTEGTGDGGEVAASTDAQVTPSREAAGQLGDAGAGAVGTAAAPGLGLGTDQIDVTASDGATGKFSTWCRRGLAEENKSVPSFLLFYFSPLHRRDQSCIDIYSTI